MKISRKALPLLLTLHKLNKHFNKLYCFPSQRKLLSLLGKFTSLNISRRQLNYDLKALELSQIIIRIRRHRKTKHHGMEFRSTLYEITAIGYNLLFRSQVISFKVFRGILARIKAALKKKERPCAIIERKSDLYSISDILRGLKHAPL